MSPITATVTRIATLAATRGPGAWLLAVAPAAGLALAFGVDAIVGLGIAEGVGVGVLGIIDAVVKGIAGGH
ncbi:hypothetical protein [Demequina phytophila]|uniref:hypothetical protein n=1 Tax=Demequina phytophila TaxID=1638981 RepID=UPI00078111EC|nr:hypothetical protein [Demequina phytophila]